MSRIIVRPARREDAASASKVLRRSIAELCIADHKADPLLLKPWLSNKTVEQFLVWLSMADSRLFVAENAGDIIAVGSMTICGEITLNYVSPEARFCGASKALMETMEAEARSHGVKECTLTSTETAHRFYLGLGYRDTETTSSSVTSHPVYRMQKQFP